MTNTFMIKSGQLSIRDLALDFNSPKIIQVDMNAKQQVAASRDVVDQYVKSQKISYGINTGFGKLANKSISIDKLKVLQKNLVLSHATGTGAFLSPKTVRLIIILKMNALMQGYSGVRWKLIEMLQKILNAGITPLLPCKGSVGASGDLAPLAHLSLALIGEGEVLFNHQRIKAHEALNKIGLSPVELEPKEGLALLNGTQVSTALLLEATIYVQRLFDAEILAGALSLLATRANIGPFDLRIHQLRRMEAQSTVAAALLYLLQNQILAEETRQVQDPYSLRCQPQVMGACLTQLRYITDNLENEINAVTDNPLIFCQENEILSGGNFHAQWIAFAADAMATVLATMANISERRIALLMDPQLSGLPAFLVNDSGENSGFMLAHVTAAALASENKVLVHPASVDSIPTSANQEDHVSMATFAARRLQEIVDNTATVIAIEIISAVQGIDLLNSQDNLSKTLRDVYEEIRQVVPFYQSDRYMADDIEMVRKMVKKGIFKLPLQAQCNFL